MRRVLVPSIIAAVAPLLLGCLLIVLPAGPAGASVATARGTVQDRNQRGFDELNQCLSTHRRVDALYVMDVSGSLQGNDPGGRRFDALEASVAQLGVLASGGRDSIDVYGAVSTFGNSFSRPRSVQDWTRVPAQRSASVASKFRRSAETAWEAAGTSQGTNYEAALSGARSVMQARGSRADACQIVLWFTDGLFSLGDPYDVRATDKASNRMCARGGLLDQLREDQTSVVALALTGPDVDAQLGTPEYAHRRGELEAMALGRARANKCGTAPVPSGWRSGIYLSADDPTALGALFSGVAAQASGCVPRTVRTSLPARIAVSPGVRKFQLDVSADGVSDTARVVPPGGRPLTVKPGTTSYDGGEIRLTRTGSLTTVTVTMEGAGQPGNWSVALGSSRQPSAVTLYRCSDLHIDISAPAEPIQGGEPATLDAVVRDSSGAPADLTPYRGKAPGSPPRIVASSDPDADISADLTDLGTGKVRVTLTPPEDTLSIDVALAFTPRLANRAGTELSQVTGSRVVPVVPPGSFPTITPAGAIDLGATDGLDPATATLAVRGSAEGKTEVCFDRAQDIDAPASAGTMSVTSSVRCQTLDADEALDVTVSAKPSESTDGFGRAALPVTLTNADGENIEQDLVLRWELQRQVDQGRRLWLLLAALLIALALPLLALALVNRLLARFEVGDVRHATYDVRVDEDGSVTPARPVSTGDLVSTYVHGAERRHISGLGDSGVELDAKTPLNPLGSPEFVALAPPGTRMVGGDGELRRHATRVDVTGGLGAVWLLTVPDSDLRHRPGATAEASDHSVPARLTIITRGEGQEHLEQLVTRCTTALADGRWSRMKDRLEGYVAAEAPAAGEGSVEPDTLSTPADEDPFGSTEGGVATTADSYSGAGEPVAQGRGHSSRSRRSKSSRPGFTPHHGDTDDYEDPFA